MLRLAHGIMTSRIYRKRPALAEDKMKRAMKDAKGYLLMEIGEVM